MVNYKKLVAINSLITIFFLGSHQEIDSYLYPVDTLYHNDVLKMCVLHQTHKGLELYLWDPATHKAVLGLLSFFNPASLTVLPNKKEFSFIDHDRIKIKNVEKRSAQSVDLYGPYDLTLIHWIDNDNFYFSAKERRHYNLFHATRDGDLTRLTVSNTNHYVWPQKIEDHLFFIEHNINGDISIKSISYPIHEIQQRYEKLKNRASLEQEIATLMMEENSKTLYKPLLDLDDAATLLFFDKKTLNDATIGFLRMTSPTQGFFLSYNDYIQKDQKTLLIDYCIIEKEAANWNFRKLFTFALPLHLIVPHKNELALSESILPFLPFHASNSIYFNDYDDQLENLSLYAYNMKKGSTAKVEVHSSSTGIFFAPRFINNKLICGSSIDKNNLIISLQDDGFHYFEMPQIQMSL